MNTRMIRRLLAALVLSVSAQSAIAATVNVDFTDGTYQAFTSGSHTFTGSDGSSNAQRITLQ